MCFLPFPPSEPTQDKIQKGNEGVSFTTDKIVTSELSLFYSLSPSGRWVTITLY